MIHQPITVSSNMHMQPKHVQMKHSLAHLQDLIPILAGVVAYMFIPAKVGIKSCRCARECFICTCVWLHVHV